MELLLSGKHTCLVDDLDSSVISPFRWYAVTHGPRRYAFARIGKASLSMHRFLLNPGTEEFIDHINGNGLDNRRKNLRFCNLSQNQHNRSGWNKRFAQHTKEHPIYKGVWRIKRCSGRHGGRIWEAKICWQRKQWYIGSFDLPELAALAYDDWARYFHGLFARLNFPQKNELGVHAGTPQDNMADMNAKGRRKHGGLK